MHRLRRKLCQAVFVCGILCALEGISLPTSWAGVRPCPYYPACPELTEACCCTNGNFLGCFSDPLDCSQACQ
jgi:hypothetical protein